MATNDTLLESGHQPGQVSPKANEIFHCEAGSTKLPGLKRKLMVGSDAGESRVKMSCSSAGSLVSPPLFKPRPNLAMVPGFPHENGSVSGGGQADNATSNTNQEDEWKNIKVVSETLSSEAQTNDDT